MGLSLPLILGATWCTQCRVLRQLTVGGWDLRLILLSRIWIVELHVQASGVNRYLFGHVASAVSLVPAIVCKGFAGQGRCCYLSRQGLTESHISVQNLCCSGWVTWWNVMKSLYALVLYPKWVWGLSDPHEDWLDFAQVCKTSDGLGGDQQILS